MATRMRRPDTVRLEISNGDWLLVKKYLTAKEHRDMFGRVLKPMKAGDDRPVLAPTEMRVTLVQAYLLGWSLTDLNEQPLVITDELGVNPDLIETALNNLPFNDLQEIAEAIEAHAERVELERTHEKKVPISVATLSSVAT